MDKFLVIDTETTWSDRVMSIGAVIADAYDMRPLERKYYILDPEYTAGGMYSSALGRKRAGKPMICSREEAMTDLLNTCSRHNITQLFAYNALFDKGHLPELCGLEWYDIMRLAAYVQYNPMIPHGAPVCRTGRLKCGYGVQSMLRILSEDYSYCETHNALLDAVDELTIMRLLGHPIEKYRKL